MTATTTTAPAQVSRNCSLGKHNRCLGTVALFPPVDGRATAPCECTARDCDHGDRSRR